jgi:hypothetical protein
MVAEAQFLRPRIIGLARTSSGSMIECRRGSIGEPGARDISSCAASYCSGILVTGQTKFEAAISGAVIGHGY